MFVTLMLQVMLLSLFQFCYIPVLPLLHPCNTFDYNFVTPFLHHCYAFCGILCIFHIVAFCPVAFCRDSLSIHEQIVPAYVEKATFRGSNDVSITLT